MEIVLPSILQTNVCQGTSVQYTSSSRNGWKIDDLNIPPNKTLRIDQILNELLIVGSNRNWVVQTKYCELVLNIDFAEVKTVMGDELGRYYEVRDLIY